MIFEILVIGTGITITYILSTKKDKPYQIQENQYDKLMRKKRELELKEQLRINEENVVKVIDTEIVEEKEKKDFTPKREYTQEEKREYAIKMRAINEQKKAKGKEYEKYVANHFRILGYDVYENGRFKGRKDQGIDLIASKNGELNLIQCKNWNAENKYRIDHEKIKAFIGNTACFIEDNPELNNMSMKRLFVISEPILDHSAIAFINQNKEKVKYLHLPMP